MAARPRRDEVRRQRRGRALRFVVARRAHELRRAGDGAVEPADEQLALRHEQHALPVALEIRARGRLEPTEPAAGEDRRLGRVAQVGEVAALELVEALDGDARCVHGLTGARRGSCG
jgi:hypothetical protein